MQTLSTLWIRQRKIFPMRIVQKFYLKKIVIRCVLSRVAVVVLERDCFQSL